MNYDSGSYQNSFHIEFILNKSGVSSKYRLDALHVDMAYTINSVYRQMTLSASV